jgi:Icc-related predicted phosphoesterase
MSPFGRRRPKGERTRLFFATDVHGSEQCFRKWLNAAAAYRADVLILGGDVTGKLIVPIVGNGGGTWHAEIHHEQVQVDSEETLAELRKQIRMMGRYDVVVTPEEDRRLAEDPAAVPAAFARVTRESLERWAALAEERLSQAGVPAFMILGNDDDPGLADVLRESSYVRYAEDGICELPGGWQMLSFGPSTPTPWRTPRELTEEEMASGLRNLAGQLEDPARAVFNIHCPPVDTHLDQAPKLDADLRPVVDASGIQTTSAGSAAVRELIQDLQPVVGLHGHVHESPGATKLGRTVCLNPGSDYQDGVLRGAIIELDTEQGLRSWQLVQG